MVGFEVKIGIGDITGLEVGVEVNVGVGSSIEVGVELGDRV